MLKFQDYFMNSSIRDADAAAEPNRSSKPVALRLASSAMCLEAVTLNLVQDGEIANLSVPETAKAPVKDYAAAAMLFASDNPDMQVSFTHGGRTTRV
jgi:hypothetical protein